MPKPYQAVIFDMDGLIVDTENIYYNTYNQTLNELGIDIPREGYVSCVGHPVGKPTAQTPSNCTTCRSVPKTFTKRG